MASSLIVRNLCSISAYSPNCYKNQTLALSHSRFLHSNSFFNFKRQSLLSDIQTRELRTRKPRSVPVVYAAQFNFFKVLQTVWKVGKDGIEAGTNLVPNSVPRPVARLSVTIVALTLSVFILKSFLSTAFFVLATMGLAYFIYIALNKDDGGRPNGGGDSSSPTEEDPLEEARRIMEKYK